MKYDVEKVSPKVLPHDLDYLLNYLKEIKSNAEEAIKIVEELKELEG